MTADDTFTWTVEPDGPVCVVTAAGRLDPTAAAPFKEAVDQLVAAGHRKFVFDLGRLDYVGSLGLRVFAGLVSRSKPDGFVAVCDLTPAVQSVFDVTKLSVAVRVYPTRADAVDAARSH